MSITISTEKSLLDVAMIHRYLSEESYWAKGIPRQVVERSIENALCFGAYEDGKQVGFGTKEFIGSTRWIRLSAPAYTLYSVSDSAHPDITQPPPPQGLGLDATDLEELSGLVNNRTPVTITD